MMCCIFLAVKRYLKALVVPYVEVSKGVLLPLVISAFFLKQKKSGVGCWKMC